MTYTILIIDDEAAERAMLCTAIREKLQYKIIEAGSESQALHYLSSADVKKPDIILFDISKAARPAEKIANVKLINKSIPIVVLVKYGDYEAALAAIEAGAYDFLAKPVAIERMRITFRNTIITRDLCNTGGKDCLENIMTFSLLSDDGNIRKIHDLEKEAINRAIQHYDGCMAEVARRLGIGRSTLYRKLGCNNRTTETYV